MVASQDRLRDLVPRGHDQRRLALLVHTAEPTCVGKQLTLLRVTDAGGLAYLHRHTAARAGVAIAGNYNRFLSSSFHSRPPKHLNEPAGMARARDYWVTLAGILLFSVASWATDCWGH